MAKVAAYNIMFEVFIVVVVVVDGAIATRLAAGEHASYEGTTGAAEDA